MPEIGTLPVQGAYIADKKTAIKGALELGNVDNTPDLLKPVSADQALADTAAKNAAIAAATTALNEAMATLADAIDALGASKQDALTAVTSVNKPSHGTVSVTLFKNFVGVTQASYNDLVAGNGGTRDPDTVYLLLS